jgi:hypothetical protein
MSIVLGLAVTQLLKGVAQLYRGRRRVRTYWLHWAWVTLLVIFSFLLWWTFWNYRSIAEWNFPRFVIYLCPTIVFYFLTAIAFPDPSDLVVDMKEYYYSNRAGFFGDCLCRILQTSSVLRWSACWSSACGARASASMLSC